MSAQRPRVVGIGEVLWDLLPHGERLLGGAPANFAYFAGALGADAVLVSRVGDDDLGREALRQLGAKGLDTGAVTRDPIHETGKASVAIDEAGVPCFVIHEPAAWDFIPAGEALGEIARAQAVCFGTLARRSPVSRASIHELVAAAPAGALRVFDANLRAPFFTEARITEGLDLANVLKINEEELAILSRMYGLAGDEVERLRTLQDRFGLRLVTLTKGPAGSLIVRGEDVSRHAGIRTEVADTIGAGDSFTATLVIGLLEGAELDALHGRAARLATYVCSQAGATPPLPPDYLPPATPKQGTP